MANFWVVRSFLFRGFLPIATYTNRRMRRAFLAYAKKMKWADPYFITVTLKAGIMTPQGWVPCTQERAEQNVRHWINCLNRDLFGRRGRRRVLLRCLPVREGGDGVVRMHYHIIVDRPETTSDLDFRCVAVLAWRLTQFGAHEVDVQRCSDLGGPLNYIAKFRSKTDYGLSIDWVNVHNPE